MERNEREAHNVMSRPLMTLHRTTEVRAPVDIDGPHVRKGKWPRVGAAILVASAGLVVAIFWMVLK